MARPSKGRQRTRRKTKKVDCMSTAGVVPRPLVQQKPTLSLQVIARRDLLGRAIIVSILTYRLFPPFEFPPSARHQNACLLCFESRLVPGVGAGGSPPQYHGYGVNPAASCDGILLRARVRLGTWHGGGTVVDVLWPSEW